VSTLSFDIAILGGGIAGALAAHKLVERGFHPLVIDRGVLLNQSQIEEIFSEQSVLLSAHVPKAEVSFAQKKNQKKYLPQAVGGLARFYAGVSLRMREKEFEAWPFSYSAIEPFYSEAEKLLSVSGNAGADPLEPFRSSDFPLPLPPMSELSKVLFRGAEKSGAKPFQHPFAIDFTHCKRCNYCNQVPCPVDAKWSPDRILKALHENKKITLWDESTVQKVLWEKKGSEIQITGILVKKNKGESHRVEASKYLLTAGALTSPLLLLQSGLQEQFPLLGTHLMTHCLGLVVGVFPKQISAENDFHKWFSVDDFYFEDNGEVRGLIQQDHLTTWERVVGRFPKYLQPLIEFFYYRTCQLLIIAEDEPQKSNRIDASSELNRVVVHQNFSKKDLQKRKFLTKMAKKIMRKSGAAFSLNFAGQSVYHACGTARMGDSPDRAVTNANGQVWGTSNLYIGDASTFTTSSGVNPSLTIAANALRIAAHL